EGMALGVVASGARFGSLGCDGFDESGEHDAMRALRDGVRLERSYDWDETARIKVEVRPFAPGETVPGSTARPELVVIGTGPVARALSPIARSRACTRPSVWTLVRRRPKRSRSRPSRTSSRYAEDETDLLSPEARDPGRLALGLVTSRGGRIVGLVRGFAKPVRMP